MLKRLLLSFLILSALAAEGVVNLPASFYNLYLYAGISDTVPGISIQPEQGKLSSAGRLTGSRLYPGGFYLSQKSQFNISGHSIDSDFTVKPIQRYLTVTAVLPTKPGFIQDENLVFGSSDISPPLYLS